MEWRPKKNKKSKSKKNKKRKAKKEKRVEHMEPSPPLASFDKFHFICDRAEEDFSLDQLYFIPERGISYHKFDLNFEERNWFGLAVQPRDAVQGIVGEFYANGRYLEPSVGYVRGHPIEVTAKRINEHCGVPDIANCQFDILKRDGFNSVNMAEVNECLGVDATMWYGMVELRLPAMRMNAISMVVHEFICARIIPTERTSVVNLERAVLNWCIQERKPINWGSIVHDVIWEATKGEGVDGYPFPHLITEICAASGVMVLPCMRRLPPSRPLVDFGALDRRIAFEKGDLSREDLLEEDQDQLAREEAQVEVIYRKVLGRLNTFVIAKLQRDVESLKRGMDAQICTSTTLRENEQRMHKFINESLGNLKEGITSIRTDLSSLRQESGSSSPKDT